MKETDKIIIPLSKTKITLLTFGAIAFVVVGFLFTINPEKYVTLIFRNKELIRIAGIASIGFFGLCGIYLTLKLFDTKPGLIIDQNGVLDNSSGISAGLISWNDVQHIDKLEIARQRFIMIIVSNPEDYIKRQNNGFKRRVMKLNLKKYETPLQISTNGLKIEFDRLHNALINSWKKYAN